MGGRAVRLFLAGDVMTGRGIDQILPHPSPPHLFEPAVRDAREYVTLAEARNGAIARTGDPARVWGEALAELSAFAPDARVVNLETSVTQSEEAWPGKGIHYRMHPANVGCLTAARIDLCVLANNHVLDWGRAGLLETLDTLRRAGMQTVGAGRTRDEAERPAIVEARGARGVVVVARAHATSGVPAAWQATGDRAGVARLPDLSDDAADAIAARARDGKRPGEVTVASLHWGSNWGWEVPASHVRFAHALVDRGVDVVHGHSSHHARPIEVYRRKLILYGCGDLLDDYEGIRGYEEYRGDLALLHFADVDVATGELIELVMTPMRVRRLRLERAAPADARWLGDRLARLSAPLGARVARGADDRLRVVVGA